jgi:hypothetical protein
MTVVSILSIMLFWLSSWLNIFLNSLRKTVNLVAISMLLWLVLLVASAGMPVTAWTYLNVLFCTLLLTCCRCCCWCCCCLFVCLFVKVVLALLFHSYRNYFCFLLILDHGRPCSLCTLQDASCCLMQHEGGVFLGFLQLSVLCGPPHLTQL